MTHKETLFRQFGAIDIYLFDQLLKGRFDSRKKTLEVGCGHGRNLHYLLKNGFDVYAVDQSETAVANIRQAAAALNSKAAPENFRTAEADALPFENEKFDAVIAIALLHFAKDEPHFYRMLHEMWRVLAKDGILFMRLATSIGIEDKIQQIEGRRFILPDGSHRFLADEAMLIKAAKDLGAALTDPLKTTNVQNLRCMSTLCLHKKK
ncbi:MAG: class I SAM-dependent methyltransferase [bacterium]|nr:class I SAM-dependent methyltransferase [bacterium]